MKRILVGLLLALPLVIAACATIPPPPPGDTWLKIRLDDRAPAYLIGKELNIPPAHDRTRKRLVSIPAWSCDDHNCEPCNDVASCDVMPPVQPSGYLRTENAYYEENGVQTIVRILSVYIER